MNGLSEDDSSDSSSEYLVDPDKINLNCSSFTVKNTKVFSVTKKSDSEDDSSDDENLEDVYQPGNIELFTQVLHNLENSQKLKIDEDYSNNRQIISQSSPLKKKDGTEQKCKRETYATSNSVDINELLLQGETNVILSSKKDFSDTEVKNEDNVETSNDYKIPKEGVNIILPGTSIMLKKKKKGTQDLKAILRRRLRASQILVEKVGLLCWLAYGFNLNRQINQPEIMTGVLSLISTCNYPKTKIDLKYLEKFTKWFKNVFKFEDVNSNGTQKIDKESLLKILAEKKISDYKELVLLYIATLRALGLNCRLVISLCPPHRIYSNNPLLKNDTKETKSKSDNEEKVKKTNKKKRKGDSDKVTIVPNSSQAKKNANAEAKKRAAEILHSEQQSNAKKGKIDSNKDFISKKESSSRNIRKKRNFESVECDNNRANLRQLRSRKVDTNTRKDNATKATDSSSGADNVKSKYYIEDNSTDSETEFQPKSRSAIKKKIESNTKEQAECSKNVSKRSNRKLISSDSEDEDTAKTKNSQDLWVEIYLESEESWICASIMEEKIHCVNEVYKKAKKPVLYVVAWNADGTIKDVTRRYCPQWLTITRKQRVDEKWWRESISYWKEKDTIISKAEDEMLLQRELEQPLPKTIGQCKGHPLYVIARHLLKFEGLYPPNCVPLGHTSTGDAIYSRHCVHTLCSRETWLKKARVVKPSQEPYKIVKARPKYDKLSGMKIKDSALELFGEWQTTEYDPPVAKDGIVPRNEYGNVDLFQPSMLPKGTVHINLPGLNRIARKMNIDCAPAVVGFNFGCMGAVPALEGYIVCCEFEDTLRDAWEAEQVEAEKRAKEKQQKRVYGNWKRLIHGLIIRERLAAKYEFSKEIKSVTKKRTKQKEGAAKKTKVY